MKVAALGYLYSLEKVPVAKVAGVEEVQHFQSPLWKTPNVGCTHQTHEAVPGQPNQTGEGIVWVM